MDLVLEGKQQQNKLAGFDRSVTGCACFPPTKPLSVSLLIPVWVCVGVCARLPEPDVCAVNK